MTRLKRFVFPALAILLPCGGIAGEIATQAGTVRIDEIARGLDEPWSLAFLPDGGFLVTERAGRLTRYGAEGGEGADVSGLPRIRARGQGGLFDILVPRDFAQTREVLFSYAEPQGTVLARGLLDGAALSEVRVLWRMPEGSTGGRHFGGRIVEAADGTIFLTLGERGDAPLSQDPGRLNGKVIRLDRDGSVPGNNPFPNSEHPEIWSLGHRNPQGATLDPEGRLWVNEHGAKGGDEVNLVLGGANYGWPVITYGTDYDGSPIGLGTRAEGMEQPRHYWDPSIAPSGLMIYSGRLWPEWTGDMFSGSLKFNYVSRLDPDRKGTGGWAEERLAGPETQRVRDVREGPDGAIWFVSVGQGAVYRMRPAEGG